MVSTYSYIIGFVFLLSFFCIIASYKKMTLVKNILKGIIAFFIFYFSSIFKIVLAYLFKIPSNDTTNILLSTCSNLILILILFFMYRSELKKEFLLFKKKFGYNLDQGFKYWLFGLATMMVSNIIIGLIVKSQATNEELVQQMIKSVPWLMVINAGIIAPIIEEIVFRKCFKNVFKNKWVFVLASGLVFGSLHVIPDIVAGLAGMYELLYIIPYSALGMSFAYMYYKTDTIFTSMSMHMLHNTILVLLSIMH